MACLEASVRNDSGKHGRVSALIELVDLPFSSPAAGSLSRTQRCLSWHRKALAKLGPVAAKDLEHFILKM